MFKLELVETKRGRAICETTPRYDVMLNGARAGQIIFNMRGFIGALPMPDGRRIDIGERPISAFRAEVRRLNKEGRSRPA